MLRVCAGLGFRPLGFFGLKTLKGAAMRGLRFFDMDSGCWFWFYNGFRKGLEPASSPCLCVLGPAAVPFLRFVYHTGPRV